jgi:hypothetical protein
MFVLTVVAALAAPVTVPVSGFYTDTNGVPLSGTQQVTIQLWTAESGGTAIGETMTVTFQDGAFQAILGSGGGLDASAFAVPRWMSLTVGEGAASSRVPIASAPRAAFAEQAGHAEVADALSAPYLWTDLDMTGAPGWASSAPVPGSGVTITGTTFALDTDVVDGRVTTGNQTHTGTRAWGGASTFNAPATFNQGITTAGTSSIGGATTFTSAPTFNAGVTIAGASTIGGNPSFTGVPTFSGVPSFQAGISVAGTSTIGGATTFSTSPTFSAGANLQGTTSLATMNVSGVATFNNSVLVNGTITAVGVNEWPSVIRLDTATNTNRVHFMAQRSRAGGAVASGDTLGGLGMGGKYDATNYAYGWNGGAEVSGIAAQNWTASARGTDLVFGTTGLNAVNIAERMRISADGSSKITGPLEVNGSFIRSIARVQGYANDQTDSGNLAGRGLSFTKRFTDTGVRVTWSDNFRVLGNNNACQWEVMFNGNACASPGALVHGKYEGNTSSNRHDMGTFVGTCFGLAAGTVTISTRVYAVSGYSGPDCYTGWPSQLFSIEAEEVR